MTKTEALYVVMVLQDKGLKARRRAAAKDDCWVEVLTSDERKVKTELLTASEARTYIDSH